ncbi:MAG: squalene--hopene cyclase [Hyphomicrobiales bacterium]
MTSAAPAVRLAETTAPPGVAAHARAVARQSAAELLKLQKPDGHFVFELEADVTIPSEYIFLNHFLGDTEPGLEAELGDYIRSLQSDAHGGWPLFHDGDFNISSSVKAYFALKILGDRADAPHMVRAREAILKHGGAETSNVFTRYILALFGEVPWHAVPAMPVELMLMPKSAPVSVWKFAYWSRTVIAPLLILAALKPRAKNPTNASCQELFRTSPDKVTQWNVNPTGSRWGEFFLGLDKVLQPFDRHVLGKLPTRQKAIQAAIDFITPRLNGEDGLGAIFPAMAFSTMAFDSLGYGREHPHFVTARQSVKNLLVGSREERGGRARYCQPCVSPIWDTSLALHALLDAGVPADDPRIIAGCDWLADRQILDVVGDWAVMNPGLKPGGWAFQYRNDYYPDVDDTAVVGMLLDRVDRQRYAMNIERAVIWIEGMQSSNGGWGAFDIDNNADFLNSIPFADHGALLDPPTVDVTARCVSFLCQVGHPRGHPVVTKALDFIRSEQEADGSWFGRWGTNYVYGTWSALCALNAAGEDPQSPTVRRAVAWLVKHQRADGGWGEDGATYWKERRYEAKASTPSQTAWAVLGLMAAGETDHEAVARGVKHLADGPRSGARWDEEYYTAVGFPRVFYLRYHGYAAYFPTWALGRYGELMRGNSRQVRYGM